MTQAQLHILQHSLGVDQLGQGKQYRNHFCAGGSDEAICRELVSLGYMRTWSNANAEGRTEVFPYFNCSVTDAGKEAMRRESPEPPKLTRSQIRYRRFLSHDSGMSFGGWMKIKWEDEVYR